MAAPQQLLLVWESEVVRDGENSVRVTARRPLSVMTAKQAGKVLHLSSWSVTNLWRLGLITGYKPGAVSTRRDGRASNARLVLDAESVLRYKAAQQAQAKEWQARADRVS